MIGVGGHGGWTCGGRGAGGGRRGWPDRRASVRRPWLAAAKDGACPQPGANPSVEPGFLLDPERAINFIQMDGFE